MGNNSSTTIAVAQRLESGIRFGKEQVTFNEPLWGMEEPLSKLRPRFKDMGYDLHWFERIINDGIDVSSSGAPEYNMRPSVRYETTVEIKRLSDMTTIPETDWIAWLGKK